MTETAPMTNDQYWHNLSDFHDRIEQLEAAGDQLAAMLRMALPACPIHGDHRLHQYWLYVSDRGYEALEGWKKVAS